MRDNGITVHAWDVNAPQAPYGKAAALRAVVIDGIPHDSEPWSFPAATAVWRTYGTGLLGAAVTARSGTGGGPGIGTPSTRRGWS